MRGWTPPDRTGGQASLDGAPAVAKGADGQGNLRKDGLDELLKDKLLLEG